MMVATLPTYVFIPLETTIPVPRPWVTVVAEYAILVLPPIDTQFLFLLFFISRTFACLVAGNDSPVNRATSISKFTLSTSRKSAGTTTPVVSLTIPPTTKVSALTISILPSRITCEDGAAKAEG